MSVFTSIYAYKTPIRLICLKRYTNADLKICQQHRLRVKISRSFTLKHLLLSEICARGICEKFVYKHSETVEYVKN